MQLAKLSKREQILLLVLLVIGICIGGYYLAIEPQMKQMEVLKQEHEAVKVKYDEFVAAMNPKHPVYNNLSVMDSKVRMLTTLFFPELRQEKFILLLNEQVAQAGIDPSSISYTEESSYQGAGGAGQSQNGQAPQLDIIQELKDSYLGTTGDTQKKLSPEELAKQQEELMKLLVSVKKQSVNLSYQGNFGEFLEFLETLEGYSRRIAVDSVSMSDFAGIQECQVQLSYFAIPKIHEQDTDFMAWDLTGDYGKPDPFSGDRPTEKAIAQGSAVQMAAKPDFFMMLNPITADLTTVILSKKGDKTRETYVFADNEAFEPVTIELTEKGGKYYYAYATSKEKYPTDDQPVAFVPNGNVIRFEVLSSKRNNFNDKSGIELTVVNKTSLKCQLDVTDDDPQKSRIKWVKKSSNVIINMK